MFACSAVWRFGRSTVRRFEGLTNKDLWTVLVLTVFNLLTVWRFEVLGMRSCELALASFYHLRSFSPCGIPPLCLPWVPFASLGFSWLPLAYLGCLRLSLASYVFTCFSYLFPVLTQQIDCKVKQATPQVYKTRLFDQNESMFDAEMVPHMIPGSNKKIKTNGHLNSYKTSLFRHTRSFWP